MKSSLAKQLLGGLGTLLYMGFLSPIVLVATQSSLTAQSSPSSTAYCNQQRNQVTEATAQEWLARSQYLVQRGQLEGSRTLLIAQRGQPEQAAQVLMRALQLTQRSPNMRFKVEIIRNTMDSTPTGVLQELVDWSVEAQTPATALSVLPLTLQITQTVPTAYSWVKTQSLTAIAKHYIALGQPQSAVEILAQATQSAQFLQGAEFQAKALTAIAQQYANLGNRDRVIALLDQSLPFAQQVQNSNSLRRASLFQTIAITYAKAGQFDRAIAVAQLISDPDEAAAYVRNEAIAAIVDEYAKANQIDQALRLNESLTDQRLKAATLARFAGTFASLGAAEQSQNLLNQAIAVAQAEPNPGLRQYGFVNIAQVYAQASGYPTGALSVVNLITEPATKARALINLAALETDANQATVLVAQGLAAANQVNRWDLRIELISDVIDAHLSANRFAIALQMAQSLPDDNELFDRKYNMVRRIGLQALLAEEFTFARQAFETLPPNWSDYRNQGLRDVAAGYAKARQFDQAMQVFQRVDNEGNYPYQVRTLAAIAEQAAARGDRNRANALLTQALQITNQFTFPNHKSNGLTTLAIEYARMGQADRATQLRSQAMQVATARGIPDSGYQLRQMVEQYVNAGYYEYAMQMAIGIRDEGERWRTLNEIAAKLIEIEQFDRAVRAANGLSTPEERTRFLVEVMHHYVADGNLEQASAILAPAFETAKTISGAESRTIAIRSDRVMADPFDRGSFLEAIALKYIDLGQYDQAMQVVQALQTLAIRTSLMQRLACYR